MAHSLVQEYGLSAEEILTGISNKFRAKVAVEGVIAELQMENHIKKAHKQKIIEKFEVQDKDGEPDFLVWLPKIKRPLSLECKNVRNSDEAYRDGGKIVAYKVETQKTRASKDDPTSRYYGTNQFDILGVCLGKKTKDWRNFVFVRAKALEFHGTHKGKLAVMQRVPLPTDKSILPWYRDIGELLKAEYFKS